MIRYELYGFDHIAALPPELQAQIYDDLQELEIDPTNKRGDWRSSIREY